MRGVVAVCSRTEKHFRLKCKLGGFIQNGLSQDGWVGGGGGGGGPGSQCRVLQPLPHNRDVMAMSTVMLNSLKVSDQPVDQKYLRTTLYL